jgi:PhnB protein
MKIHEVFPYLRVNSTEAAIAFYGKAFGAEEIFRLTEPSGRIGHAEMKLGGVTLMLSDEFPEYGIVGPLTLGGTTFAMHLHLDDVDAAHAQALAAGATEVSAPTDAFYGERGSKVRDPFGHEWMLGSEIEKVTPEEMQRRYTEMMTSSTSGA